MNIALAGATGAVGNQMIECLQESDFPINEIKMLASSRSAGRELTFRGQTIAVEEMIVFYPVYKYTYAAIM